MEDETFLHKKILTGCLIASLILIFLAFCTIWILVPVSFMLSLPFQTFMVFVPIESPRNPHFDHPENHGINETYNVYVSVHDRITNQSTTIGVWLVLPQGETANSIEDALDFIRNGHHDILMYFHGVLANRAKPISQYQVFRKHFIVLGIDHRGYGDSGENVDMTEIGIVEDHRQIYQWIRRLNNDSVAIYYWGHSLGSGLATHTLRHLKNELNTVPKGLILESPFTSLEDVIRSIIFNDIFGWLAYFDSTVVEPLHENGLQFSSFEHIRLVDCPVMILHAEDDLIVPFVLGERLSKIAKEHRTNDQGEVFFHSYPKELGYNHNGITSDPGIDKKIVDFIDNCRQFGQH